MDPRITTLKATTLSGRRLARGRTADVQETVAHLPNGSRNGPVKVIRGHLNRKTAKGHCRVGACMGMLEILEARGVLKLPAKREARAGDGDGTPVRITESGPQPETGATLAQLAPAPLEPVTDTGGRQLWNALAGRHHCLGHRKPFGQHVRHSSSTGTDAGRAACCPALARSRFRRGTGGRSGRTGSATATAIRWYATHASWCLPGVRVRNLATDTSHALGLAARRPGASARLPPGPRGSFGIGLLLHITALWFPGKKVWNQASGRIHVFPSRLFTSCGTACPSFPLLETG